MLKLTESLELVALCSLGLVIGEGAADFVFVDHNSIVVNFTEAVRLLQIVPADLVVVRDVIAFAVTTDAHVDVVNPGIVVHKDDVVVEDKNIYDKHGELYKKSHEKPNKSR